MSSLLTSLTHAASVSPLGVTSGDYVSAAGSGVFPTSLSTVTPNSANQFFLIPRYVRGTQTYNQASVEVTTGGTSSVARIGCFANDPTTGRPAALLLDAGELDLSTTGVKTATISLTVADQWVWDWIIFNNTAAVLRGSTTAFASVIHPVVNNDTGIRANRFASFTYGAAPATCPATSQGDSRWFRIQWKIA